MWFHHRLPAFAVAVLSGSACGGFLYELLVLTGRIGVVNGALWRYPELSGLPGWIGGALLLPVAVLSARDRGKMLARLAAACSPWMLLIPMSFLPESLTFLGVKLALFGWGIFRLGYLFGPVLPQQEITAGKARLLVGAIWAVCAAYGYWAQFQAHITMFFIYGDWSQYAEHYLNLMNGAPFKAWLAGAGHFNPLVNVVMTGALTLRNAPETIFVVNALLISSAVPLGYALARKNGAGIPVALAVALAAACNPALSHQYLGFIYGFHPIAFMVPLMLGYFLLIKSPWRWLCFVASLLVQETAAVFWGGYGLYLLTFGKKRQTGAVMMAGMLCWFFIIGHWVLPWTHDMAQYTQMFHYSALGDSLWEAALSPILRPAAFFRAVLHPQSLSFVLLSAVPLWFAWGADWRKAVAVLPLYAGVCMQDSPAVKTIALQYSMEISVWFLAVTSCMWNGKIRTPHWWRCGLPAGKFVTGSVWAVLAVTLLSWILVGYAVPYGKYSVEWGVKCADSRPDLYLWEEEGILDSRRILSTSCLRNHFLFRKSAVLPISADPQEGDAVFLEMHNPMFDSTAAVEEMRLKLLHLPHGRFAGGFPCGSGWISVWCVGDVVPEVFPLPVISEMEYVRLGDELPSGDPHIRVRLRLDQKYFHFAVRVETVPDYDVELGLQTEGGTYKIPYGRGGFPAYRCSAGTVWEYSFPHNGNTKFRMQVFKRAGSAEAWEKWQKEKK
ncbi:MAG: DUF2079 domain-containing protein [Lentisphaeria bacterium]|nr:DUF2079 domain-containing protein [Lentisphaeria bacterium]